MFFFALDAALAAAAIAAAARTLYTLGSLLLRFLPSRLV
jgi:hypothetical protein